MDLAQLESSTYKEEFIKIHNIQDQRDLNDYINKHKPINIGLFISPIRKE